jgi:hypothetical protein
MRKYFVLFFVLMSFTFAQLMRPTQHALISDTLIQGLIGNGIGDIAGQGDTLWFTTGYGLSGTYDYGDSFFGISRQFSNIGKGSLSALATSGDTLWFATGFDSVINAESYQTGGGISYSTNAGQSWTSFEQPMDSLRWYTDNNGQQKSYTYSGFEVYGDTVLAVDVVTPITNITFDLAYDGKRLWATSFAGGLRVSHNHGQTWRRVLLPWDDVDILNETVFNSMLSDIKASPEYYSIDPVLHMNHRAFSVVARNDTIVVGTAGGINLSLDGGISWQRWTSLNSNITGNWVVALHLQTTPDDIIIWASTVNTNSRETQGISALSLNNRYWETALEGFRINNFGSNEQFVYAATDDGLYVSRDGLHFLNFPTIVSSDGRDRIYSESVFSVFVDDYNRIWVGTGDGLAWSDDKGETWQIEKSGQAVEDDTFFAYPNPFSPRHQKVFQGEGNLIIRFTAQSNTSITLDVYDFSMRRVRNILDGVPSVFDGKQETTWNGKNEKGEYIANGTYFLRLQKADKSFWSKVMIVN